MRAALKASALLAMSLAAAPALSQTQTGADAAPAPAMSAGHLVAMAGDCGACHGAPDGSSEYAGGLALATPMGTIYARNITPDPETGIGGWTLEDFDRAVRQGKSKTVGHLFPAMPYTSYRAMTDEDLKALFDYFMNEVAPVRHEVPATDLGFPFVRPAMIGWNLLFAGNDAPRKIEGASEEVQRGQYLVDVLGHCGECHTPRGMMYQSLSRSRHLGGSLVGGWYAPNISSDATGIGGWSEGDLEAFLERGRHNHAVAGGDMGVAVRLSLAHLPASDIAAIAAYLKAGPATPGTPNAPVPASVATLDLAEAEPVNATAEAYFDNGSTDGGMLYVAACAACHGVDGSLVKGDGPSLVQSRAVRAPNAINVVQTITSGIDPGELNRMALMPAFRNAFTDAQIAAITSYVRARFGGIATGVSEADVGTILAGRDGIPWLIGNARWLAWTGAGAALVLLIGVILILRRSKAA